ncbi:MAG: hypothetical protein CO128_02155 [Ignavibacteriales bacterium CG_4_9_14_3_um_filter_30_11]|nr:MAG: hypothetical protein CO128_02155 [Ignavibacteriales bacterium CG_4_9_14_3_um_filter_30_11]
MNSELNKLIAELFSDSNRIQILCSIYENEVTAAEIANLLNISEEEVTEQLEILCRQSLIKLKEKRNDIVYSLRNPKICDSILMLKDSISHRQESN